MLKPGFEKANLEENRFQEDKTAPAANTRIKARVRFDYRGKARPSRFFFGGKTTEEVAGELRQQQAALWRNVPLQGVIVENIEVGEIYSVYDDEAEDQVAYAPMELELTAESLDDLVRFAVREEFRRLQILEPERLALPRHDMERIFFQVHEQVKTQLYLKAKRWGQE